jgi:para-aminobenzoate synthetase/4-amino-4-deoxychorismate lyase
MFFGFKWPEDLEARVRSRLSTRKDPSRVRLLLSRNGEFELQCTDAPLARTMPVLLAIDDDPVSSQSTMLFHKTTRRDAYNRRRRKFPRADDVVLINERGECTETTIANIVARLGDSWFTPPLSTGCLPGIGRARLVDAGVVTEAILRPEDLRGAGDLAVVSSLRGWQRATLWTDDAGATGNLSTNSPRTRI